MKAVRLLGMLLFTGLAGCASAQSLPTPGPFDINQMTVDGLPLPAHVGMLELLRLFAGRPHAGRRAASEGRTR